MCLVSGSSLSFYFRSAVKIFDESILRWFFGLCKSVLLVSFNSSSVAYLIGMICMFEVLVKLPVFTLSAVIYFIILAWDNLLL